jgi:hypothetical protein
MVTITETGMWTPKKAAHPVCGPPLQRRSKAVSALKGINLCQNCLATIEKELTKDETQGLMALPFGHESLDCLEALQAKIFEGWTPPGDSTELIRETRDSRNVGLVCGVVVAEVRLVVK